MTSPYRVMIVAGEASGDKHGARLVAALREASPGQQWDIFGAGGDEMRAQGVDTLVDAKEVAIMGLLEIAMAMRKLLTAFRRLRDAARTRRPHLVILIDWPEFNLRLARRLKKDGQRIAYYISPQVWAWRSHRVTAIKRDVEQMLVILPFERDYYARAGVSVDYVGHPLLDSVFVTVARDEFCRRNNLDPGQKIVALLPGSRYTELKYILPPMLDAIHELNRTDPAIQFVIPMAHTVRSDELSAFGEIPAQVRLIAGDTYNAIAAADLAVVASGTATLETAIIGTPLIVVYRASQLNWRIFFPLIRTEFVGLPNLIAGEKIAPELLQDEMNGGRLSQEIRELLRSEPRLARQRQSLAKVRQTLGESDASKRAAERIIQLLNNSAQPS